MDARQRELFKQLRSLSSQDAADWLASLPLGDAAFLVAHRSWARAEHQRIADLVLSNIPHSTERGYRAVAAATSVDTLLAVVRSRVDSLDAPRVDLLRYYLVPVLRDLATTERQVSAVEEFLAECGWSKRAAGV